MKITVLGCGYLGVTHAACLTRLGFDVLGVDTDHARVTALSAGRLPFHEQGLPELLAEGLRSGRLRFTSSYEDAAAFGDVHFICAGTPTSPATGSVELSQVTACITALAPLLTRRCLIAGKSTVPPGTAARLARMVDQLSPAKVDLAWCPEFLREGQAVWDVLMPDRIVAGVSSPYAETVLRKVYAGPVAVGVPFLVTDLVTAELAKLAANAFLSMKISFINAMAEVCDETGADVLQLTETLAADPRIGADGMAPGLGFGGSCLPKDLLAFQALASDLRLPRVADILDIVEGINWETSRRVLQLACDLADGTVPWPTGTWMGKTAAVLGLAFKPGTDDIRSSPALAVAEMILASGGEVRVYDPAVREIRPGLLYTQAADSAAAGADVLIVATEWPEFRDLDPVALGKVAGQLNVVDARHCLDRARWQAAGWAYRAPGRPALQ